MNDFHHLMAETLIVLQFITVIVALFCLPKLKNSHWKWFVFYICIVFIVEALSRWGLKNHSSYRVYLYDFFGIPIQFLFFYWLYANKSLRNKRLFWICCGIYILSFLPYFMIFTKVNIVYSLSYTVGNILLMLLVFLEIFKQIKSEKILEFRTNMMFYINIGIMFFYIGTLPFFSFYGLIYKNHALWVNYYAFFMVANHVMYLLFIAALIWGKPNTY